MLRLATAVALLTALVAGCGGGGPKTPLDQGREIYGDVCSVCHGRRGEGGVGPSLDAVDETFPACTDQIEWISLGSDRWRETHGDTYGATDKPVNGGMQPQAESLSAAEIALVAAFERVEFAEAAETAALDACGVPPASTASAAPG